MERDGTRLVTWLSQERRHKKASSALVPCWVHMLKGAVLRVHLFVLKELAKKSVFNTLIFFTVKLTEDSSLSNFLA